MIGVCENLRDLAAGRKAVKLRHHDIHDNDIELLPPADADRLHAVGSLGDGMTFKFGVFADNGANTLLVVDDKNMVHIDRSCHKIYFLLYRISRKNASV